LFFLKLPGSFCLAFWSQTRIAFWLQFLCVEGSLMRDPVPVRGVIPLSLDLMRHLGPALDGAMGGEEGDELVAEPDWVI